MNYIDLLNLKKEPFSISPDPHFFYHSKDYEDCLQKLELSIRLRRGLNIVLGDVGTGKTTLSRALIQLFQGYDEFRFHLILDPSFNSEDEFLLALVKIFNITVPQENNCLAFKEAIRTYLLKEGLERKRIIVLIIDETQKMDYPFLELLRDFLNFETNEYKLLQLVIFGQMEFLEKVQGKKNFTDRVNFMYFLKPLSFEDTREMIEFRMRKAGYFPQQPIFSRDAYRKIHSYSQGYPRKIVNICHHALLEMLIKKKQIVDGEIVDLVAESLFPDKVFFRVKRTFLPSNIHLPPYFLLIAALSTTVVILLILLGWSFFFRAGVGNLEKNRLSIAEGGKETPLNSLHPLIDQAGEKGVEGLKVVPNGVGRRTLASSKMENSSTQLASDQEKEALQQQVNDEAYQDDSYENEKKDDLSNDLPPGSAPIKNVGKDETKIQAPAATGQFIPSPPQSTLTSKKEPTIGYRPVEAKKGDTILRMASRLYRGEITDELMLMIQRANPEVRNIDIIEPGQTIYFPVFPETMEEKTEVHIYGIQAGYFASTSEAQDCIQRLVGVDSRIYIEKDDLPGLGQRYSVILGPFTELPKALMVLEALKEKNIKSARVVIIE